MSVEGYWVGQGTPSAEGRAGLGRQSPMLSGPGSLGVQQPPLSPLPSRATVSRRAWLTGLGAVERENSTQRPHVTCVDILLDWPPANSTFI